MDRGASTSTSWLRHYERQDEERRDAFNMINSARQHQG